MSTSATSDEKFSSNQAKDSAPDADPVTLEQSIRAGREFSLAEVIGREAGDFLKGESPIPPLEQTKHKIAVFIEEYLQDSEGILKLILQNWIDDEARLSRYQDDPLKALAEQLAEILSHPNLLYELVRQVDVKWGQINQERPYFQRPGQKPNPNDVYTHESVYEVLSQLNDRLAGGSDTE